MTISVGTLCLMLLAAIGPQGSGRAAASFGAFIALLAALIQVARGGAPGRSRPVLALVVGLLAGAAGAASMLSLGVLAPASPLWVYLPLVFGTLGTIIGGPASKRAGEDPQVAPRRTTARDRRLAGPSGTAVDIRYGAHLASETPTGS